jgi:hypothetical protein
MILPLWAAICLGVVVLVALLLLFSFIEDLFDGL